MQAIALMVPSPRHPSPRTKIDGQKADLVGRCAGFESEVALTRTNEERVGDDRAAVAAALAPAFERHSCKTERLAVDSQIKIVVRLEPVIPPSGISAAQSVLPLGVVSRQPVMTRPPLRITLPLACQVIGADSVSESSGPNTSGSASRWLPSPMMTSTGRFNPALLLARNASCARVNVANGPSLPSPAGSDGLPDQ